MVSTSVLIREGTQDKVDKYYKTAWIKCFSLVWFPEMPQKLKVSLQSYHIYFSLQKLTTNYFFWEMHYQKSQKIIFNTIQVITVSLLRFTVTQKKNWIKEKTCFSH